MLQSWSVWESARTSGVRGAPGTSLGESSRRTQECLPHCGTPGDSYEAVFSISVQTVPQSRQEPD